MKEGLASGRLEHWLDLWLRLLNHKPAVVLLVLISFIVLLLILLTLHYFLFRFLKKSSEKSKSLLDDILVQSLRVPTRILVILFVFTGSLQLAPEEIRHYLILTLTLKSAFFITGVWILDAFIGAVLRMVRLPGHQNRNIQVLLLTVVRFVLLSIASLMTLDTLGVSITPILASLGISSLAIALALQDTLSNLFSGAYILVDQPIRPGDYIKIGEEIEGHVRKIGWRSTHLQTLAGNTTVIPNSKVATATLTNFDMPVPEMNFSIPFMVDPQNDLSLIEKISMEIAEKIQKSNTSILKGTSPVFRIQSMTDLHLLCSVSFQIKNFTENGEVKHLFLKELLSRFQKESIRISSTPTSTTKFLRKKTT